MCQRAAHSWLDRGREKNDFSAFSFLLQMVFTIEYEEISWFNYSINRCREMGIFFLCAKFVKSVLCPVWTYFAVRAFACAFVSTPGGG